MISSKSFDLIFGKGFDPIFDLIDIALECGIISKSGSWYSYSNTNLAQGRENLAQLLEEKPDILNKIKDSVLKK